jgi:predicted protein tyrosine phosphatase
MSIEKRPINSTRQPWLWHYTCTMWQRWFGLDASQVDPFLFVGGQFQPAQWKILHALGIRAVLSLRSEYEDRFIEPYPDRVLRLMVRDGTAPSLEQLEEGVAFMQAAHDASLPVLVHCRAGVGRAPTTAAAYLVTKNNLAPNHAMRIIRDVRPIVAPNRVQMQGLQAWYQRCS